MRNIAYIVAALALVAGGVAVAAYANPPAGGPPGQGECEHGNSGKECKPDPQPGHGQDCDEHGPKNGGVNEDHCLPETTDTTPTETTPTDTTPTTTDTTPTTPTETTTAPSGPRCPPGMTPTAGKDGQPGNDECEFPKTPPPPVTTTTAGTPVAPAEVTTTVVTSSTVVSEPAKKQKTKTVTPKPDKPVVIVKVSKPKKGLVVITTSDGKKHVGVMGSG